MSDWTCVLEVWWHLTVTYTELRPVGQKVLCNTVTRNMEVWLGLVNTPIPKVFNILMVWFRKVFLKKEQLRPWWMEQKWMSADCLTHSWYRKENWNPLMPVHGMEIIMHGEHRQLMTFGYTSWVISLCVILL